MTIGNRIVTRGFGPSRGLPGRSGLITRGYGPSVPRFVAPAIQRAIRRARGGDRRYLEELQEVVIWAQLIEANDVPPKNKVQGSSRIKFDLTQKLTVNVNKIGSSVKNVIERIKVTAKRLK